MTLEDLYRLVEFHQGTERDNAKVVLVGRNGARLPALSMCWDSENECWALVGDIDA